MHRVKFLANNLANKQQHTHMLMLIIAMKIKLSMLWNQKVMRHNLMRHKVLEPKLNHLVGKHEGIISNGFDISMKEFTLWKVVVTFSKGLATLFNHLLKKNTKSGIQFNHLCIKLNNLVGLHIIKVQHTLGLCNHLGF